MVADHRNPPGRRPPILPLPPPPDSDEALPVQVPPRLPPRHRPRSPNADITSELPRLPEVGLHEESSEVRIAPPSLSPGQGSLPGARALPTPPPPPPSHPHPHPRTVKQTAPQRPPRTASAPPPAA